eukprot:scaffold1767_cov178-Ochromonas_danica.AAC.27
MSAPQWLGLLRWSLAYQDGTQTSQFNQLSEQDREWLGSVLKEVVKDEAERMNEIILSLQEKHQSGAFQSQQTEAFSLLEELQDIIEQTAAAPSGGQDSRASYSSQAGRGRPRHFDTKQSCRARQPCKAGCFGETDGSLPGGSGCFPLLEGEMNLFSHPISTQPHPHPFSPPPEQVHYAVSCLVRGHALLEEKFFQSFFLSYLSHIASLPDHLPLFHKAFFLSSSLISSDTATADRVERMVDLLLPLVVRQPSKDILLTLLHTAYGYDHCHQSPFKERLEALFLQEGDSSELGEALEEVRQCFESPCTAWYPNPEAARRLNELRQQQAQSSESQITGDVGSLALVAPPSSVSLLPANNSNDNEGDSVPAALSQ